VKLTLDGHEIEVGNADKVYFPDEAITKGQLVEYYAKVGERMLPHIAGRPVSMRRFPDGIGEEGFFQKEAPKHFPDWIERVRVRKKDGTVNHVVIRRVADLVYLAEQGCIEPHVWLSTSEHLDRPDRMVIDLDPSSDDTGLVRHAARTVHDVLDEVGVVPFVMTSGSKGFHVWVPLKATDAFDVVGRFARDVAEVVVARAPDAFTVERRKDDRGGRVLIDTVANGYGATSIPPYAVRARAGAPVATPLDWDELARTEPRSYTIGNVLQRLGQKDDPFASLRDRARSLDGPRGRLDALRAQ